jgi:hypothetical protein
MPNCRSVLIAIVLGSLLSIPGWLPADPAAAPANLLVNGSFEQVGDQPDQAAKWLRWGDWINREDSWTPTHDGKALIGYHHWQIEKSDDSGMWQDVPVQAGKTYEFAIYVQRDDPGSGHGADNVQVALESPDSDPPKTIKLVKTKVEELATGDNWSRLTVRGVATANSVRVLIRIVPSADAPRGGAVKLDDASLVQVNG